MEIVKLKLSELEPNAGQIPGLPMNPRQWTKSDVDKLARSLKETPELFEARPIIVTPYEGRYVILGGNMRYEASKVNKADAVPVVVIPEGTSTDKLKEIVIKDNGSFGAWDWDMLANEWDDLDLDGWGVPAWDMEKANEGALDALFEESNQGEKEEFMTITILLPEKYIEKDEDIRQSIKTTLEDWPGCILK